VGALGLSKIGLRKIAHIFFRDWKEVFAKKGEKKPM
jgi:hypothetical protein